MSSPTERRRRERRATSGLRRGTRPRKTRGQHVRGLQGGLATHAVGGPVPERASLGRASFNCTGNEPRADGLETTNLAVRSSRSVRFPRTSSEWSGLGSQRHVPPSGVSAAAGPSSGSRIRASSCAQRGPIRGSNLSNSGPAALHNPSVSWLSRPTRPYEAGLITRRSRVRIPPGRCTCNVSVERAACSPQPATGLARPPASEASSCFTVVGDTAA